MKKTKIVVPALGILLLSTAASVSGTVAWFSMNNAVKVTGMSVTTRVSSNLKIVGDTLASTARKADNLFVDNLTIGDLSGVLEPVSTVNGKNFFYTTNGQADGDAQADTYTAYNAAEIPTSTELDNFAEAYDSATADPKPVGYLDYVFQLKAVNAASAAKDIKITRLDLVYGGAKDPSKAYRVAVFTEDLGETGVNPAGGSGTLKGIYAPDGGNNHTANSAISATSGGPVAIATTAYNTVASIASVPANKANYYKVVVRLYLEGEDTTCTSTTFADLTQAWELNLDLKIDTASTTNTAAANIAKYTSAEVSGTKYYYNGSYVWTDPAKLGDNAEGTAIASAAADVKTAFGYGA